MRMGNGMAINRTKIVPTAVWLGLLALGFATNLGGSGKSRPVLQRNGEISETAALERPRASPAHPTPLQR